MKEGSRVLTGPKRMFNAVNRLSSLVKRYPEMLGNLPALTGRGAPVCNELIATMTGL